MYENITMKPLCAMIYADRKEKSKILEENLIGKYLAAQMISNILCF
jgi:hypothetical protein